MDQYVLSTCPSVHMYVIYNLKLLIGSHKISAQASLFGEGSMEEKKVRERKMKEGEERS